MIEEKLLMTLSQKTETKMVLLVLDGVGGLPVHGKTALETAVTPNFDRLAAESSLGFSTPVSPGITPGSGPGHLSIFGYDPLKYEIGRGVLEALGIGMELGPCDLSSRGNFCTMDLSGVVTDRRAGRISTDVNEQICVKLQETIREIDGVEIIVRPGKEHRFVVVFRGDGLAGPLTDTDPQKVGLKPLPAEPVSPDGQRAADIVNTFMNLAREVLAAEHPANACLLRGIAKVPDIPSMSMLFKLNPAAIATYPMYRGLARLVGMDILETGETVADELTTLEEHYNNHDFFYVHVKKTDSHGEDGNFEKKVKVIEEVDALLPRLLKLNPDVLAVTGDHSTPCTLEGHSWHPVPYLLKADTIRLDPGNRYTEDQCRTGALGWFLAKESMSLMMGHALKFNKYGA